MAYEQRAREDRGNWLVPSLVALAIIGGIAYAVANRDSYGTRDSMRGRFGDTTTESTTSGVITNEDTGSVTGMERSTTDTDRGTSNLGTGTKGRTDGSPSAAGRQ